MVKLTTSYLFKKISRKNQQQPRKKGEADLDYLRRVTHLQLQSQFIDKIAKIPECESVVVLYLQNNLLRNIQNLENFPRLTHLYLHNNFISRMENLGKLKSLKKLYLGNNEISVVEGLDGLINLVELHLENQRLPQGETLYFDPQTLSQLKSSLKVLNISNNNIVAIRCLSELSSLTKLIVENNRLDSLEDLMDTLQNLPLLETLEAEGNPIVSDRKFLNAAVIATNRLNVLNGKTIDEKTKQFIRNLEWSSESRNRLSCSSAFSSLNKPPPESRTFRSLDDIAVNSSKVLGSKLFPVLKAFKDTTLNNSKSLNNTYTDPVLHVTSSYKLMDNYRKGKRIEDEIKREEIPIPNLSPDFVWMQVSPGSKMKNLLEVAINAMKEDKDVVWTGVGPSLGKAISCAEILKRKFHAHQISKICYNKIEDHWDPCIPQLEPLIVQRDIPTIHILISKKELDVNELGYQGPGNCDTFWKTNTSEKPRRDNNQAQAKKRSNLLKKFTSHDGSGS